MEEDLKSLADKLSPVAREVLFEFLGKVAELERRISDTALSILVWGPGEQASDQVLYRKRCQIRDRLRDLGNAALFSEEVAKFAKTDIPVALSELAQAVSADFIVVLMASWGALSEVAKYGSDLEIGAKMLVLLPEQSKGSFAEQALLGEPYQNVVYFSEEEVERCHVVDKVITFLPKLKAAKFVYYRQRRRWEASR